MIHLKHFGFKILVNSKKVILINPTYKNRLKLLFPKEFDLFKDKITTLPNGIDHLWFKNEISPKKLAHKRPFNLVYAGTFIKRKKIPLLVQNINKLNDLNHFCNLTIIGGGGADHSKVLKLVKKSKHVDYVGKKSFEDIVNIYKNMDAFIMLSKNETFGLVYIEAMSQGLPIIYTAGESIDGYFKKGEVGYPTTINDYNGIRDCVEKIKLNFSQISENCIAYSKKFNWIDVTKTIVKQYY